MKYILSILLVTGTMLMSAYGRKNESNYIKEPDGITIRLNYNGTRLLRIIPITDKIIHVTASPAATFSFAKSLMITGEKHPSVAWMVAENQDSVTVSTATVSTKVCLHTGQVSFWDKAGKPLLAEIKDGGKTFTSITVDGAETFALRQTFQTSNDEAFYGLGQHQEGIMNYKSTCVSLNNYNTDVAIPFVMSNKHYGILWDNYSITRVIDSREPEPLSSLKLFSTTGEQGWLTTTYLSKMMPDKVVITRPESEISYDCITALKNLPDSIKLQDVTVKWEGAIASDYTGIHHIFLKSAGYAKIWIDGKLMADKWRQAWNAGPVQLAIPMEKGKKYPFRIEWNPDGGQSYISCHWLRPTQGDERNEYAFQSEAGRGIDYYFVQGDNMDEIISGYPQLTGKAAIMPQWAMGFWQSRERYKSQDEILSTVAEFRKRKIPLDNIVEDWSYWKETEWGNQEFDKTRFPDAAGMIQQLHNQHTHFMISVWPKFYEGIANYDWMNKNGWLYKRNITKRQRDWIAKGYVNTFYDAYNPKAQAAFWQLINKPLYSKGVDAWWMDASEPDINSNMSVTERKELSGPTALGSSTEYFNGYALQHAKGVYEGQRQVDSNKRVFILTRSAYAGMQRYAAATWSGDIGSRWEDFKNQIPAGLNFCMSGMPYWTTDIGGFAVEKRYEKPDAANLDEWRELQARWYQYGAFCPLFRVHGQFPYREIYNVSPEGSPVYESMLYYNKLRYRLMPYIYSLAQQTYHDDYTIMRGLPMDFAADAAVSNIADQFMFGPAILVNPVTDYKSRSRSVYLPAGQGWYHFASGKYETGGRTITADAQLSTISLLVKEGSIIPTGPAIEYTGQRRADTLTLFVYTGKDAKFNLYEDEGLNYDYERGLFSKITFQYTEANKRLSVANRTGTFPGMAVKRVFHIIFITPASNRPFNPDMKPDKTILYDGTPAVATQ